MDVTSMMKKQNKALEAMIEYCDFMRKNDMCATLDKETVDMDKINCCPFFRVYEIEEYRVKQCLYDHIDWATGALDG